MFALFVWADDGARVEPATPIRSGRADSRSSSGVASDIGRWQMLLDSGFETRETKKANKLRLDALPDHVPNRLGYNPKDVMAKMKNAKVSNRTEVEVAQN